MAGLIRSRSLWVVILLIVVSLIAIKQTSLERQDITVVEKVTRDLFTPLQSGVNVFRGYLVSFREYFVDKKMVVNENKHLQTQMKSLRLENQKLREFRAEARRLRALMAFQEENRDHMVLIPTRVIARSPNTWYETVTINKGSMDGIQKDMVAITPEGLVGRVTSVSLTSSVILLISDLEGTVGALVQETRTPGIIQGVGNSNLLSMENIPYYSVLKKGNRVVTSRLSEIYPPGILIGRIKSIRSEPDVLIKTAVVTPAVDFDKLEEILLIKDYTEPTPQEIMADEAAAKAAADRAAAAKAAREKAEAAKQEAAKREQQSENQPDQTTPTQPEPAEPAPEQAPPV